MATLPSKIARPKLPSRLAGLRQRFPSRSTLGLYMAALGPGLISALAGNDAGGIGTYSYAGANYGYRMLFLLVAITFVLALVQEMAARMGAVTQKGFGRTHPRTVRRFVDVVRAGRDVRGQHRDRRRRIRRRYRGGRIVRFEQVAHRARGCACSCGS